MTTQRLALAGVAANAAVGSLFAWSLVADEAAGGVGISSRDAAGVFAASLLVMATAVVATGRVVGRLGPRTLLVGAAVAAGSGLVLAASSHHPAGLFLGVSGLFGAANGVAYSVATTLASRVPVVRRGAATGLVVAAYAGPPVLLGVVGPPLVAEHGWRTCLVVLGAVSSGLLVLAATLVPAVSRRTDGSGPDESARSAGRTRRGTVVLLWFLFAGGTAPALMLFGQATALGAQRGLDATVAGLVVSGMAGGNLVGRLGAGWVSDTIGRLPGLAVALSAQVPALVAVSWGTTPVVVISGCAVFGLCYGAVSALVPAATADLVGVRAFPRSFAWVFSGWGAAGLVGPVVGAGLLGLAETTPAVWLLAGAPLVPAGIACWMLSRPSGPAASRHVAAAGEVGGGQDHF